MHLSKGFVAALVLGVTTIACDEGQSAREKACEAICDRFESCDDATDVADCQDECVAESFRSDRYFETREECAQSLSCNRLVDQSELDDCVGDALRNDKVSAETENICEGLANTLADCDDAIDGDEVVAACLEIAITLSATYLAESDECGRARCAEVVACLDDLADDYDTDVKLFSGSFDP
jgi:hypothetical protein